MRFAYFPLSNRQCQLCTAVPVTPLITPVTTNTVFCVGLPFKGCYFKTFYYTTLVLHLGLKLNLGVELTYLVDFSLTAKILDKGWSSWQQWQMKATVLDKWLSTWLNFFSENVSKPFYLEMRNFSDWKEYKDVGLALFNPNALGYDTVYQKWYFVNKNHSVNIN